MQYYVLGPAFVMSYLSRIEHFTFCSNIHSKAAVVLQPAVKQQLDPAVSILQLSQLLHCSSQLQL